VLPVRDHHARGQQRKMTSGMKISVIIPVLHEGDKINDLLASIESASSDMSYEIIVVDGNSDGDTIKKIADGNVIALTASQGRAAQMNAGAARACGDVLLFLHADTLLPPKAFSKIAAALSDKHFIGGAFDLEIQNHRRIFRAIGRAASWKHRLTHVPYGDQAIFMLRSYFEKIGGYAAIPLMEDVELMRRVKQLCGRIIILPQAVTTSSRKWETDGIFYTIIRNWTVQAFYLFGVPAERLVKYYYEKK
jgi:rSAM/selenodomain-associated transferase 2